MGEPFEVRQLADAEKDRERLLAASLLRAEHVWLAVAEGLGGHRWVPGVLSEWRQADDGTWQGLVSYAEVHWSPSQRMDSAPAWVGHAGQMWANADRIQRCDILSRPLDL